MTKYLEKFKMLITLVEFLEGVEDVGGGVGLEER